MRTTAVLLLLLTALAASAQQQFTVYFDHGKHVPTVPSNTALQQFLQSIAVRSVDIVTVRGYADKTGEDNYNRSLSEKRAMQVAVIIQQYWPDARIQASAFGSLFPVSDKDDELHLNRRVEITVALFDKDTIDLEPFREDVETQTFSIDLDDTVIIKGKEGTVIKIPPGSIQSRDSVVMRGAAVARLKEYYKHADMLLAGVHTASTEGLLQTGGMFSLIIIQDNDTASTNTRKQLEIRMPMNNPGLTNMNVYEQPHNDGDTMLWINTRRQFRETLSYWKWPRNNRLHGIITARDGDYNNLSVGGVFPYEDHYKWRLFRRTPMIKNYKVTIEKLDSVTLSVRATFNYRRWAFPKTGTLVWDTAYTVPYVQKEYITEIDRMNFINCDRFYDVKDPAELIVQTGDFRGMRVMLYFKKIAAFMPAERHPSGSRFSQIPKDEEVYIVAMGKRNGELYFGQQQYRTEKKGVVNLSLAKMTAEQCKKILTDITNP